MKKQQRAQHVHRALGQLFPSPPVPLKHTSPYTLLVAVLLSARCTDARVNEVSPRLFKLADNPWDMVKLKVCRIQEIIRPCGLSPRKAQSIWELSKILIDRHQGRPPKSFEELEALPGVGHKTASVVLAQAFGQETFPVDTHIHRLAQIWKLTSGSNVQRTERDLKGLFPREAWRDLHLQMILYGRQYCPAPGCDGLRCHLCQELYPHRKSPVDYKRA